MRFQDFRRLKEVSHGLEDLLDEVLLFDVDGVKHQGNEVWILLEHFDSMAGLSQIVDSDDGEALQTGMVRLQVLLDDRVELVVVCGDITSREILDHDTE